MLNRETQKQKEMFLEQLIMLSGEGFQMYKLRHILILIKRKKKNLQKQLNSTCDNRRAIPKSRSRKLCLLPLLLFLFKLNPETQLNLNSNNYI